MVEKNAETKPKKNVGGRPSKKDSINKAAIEMLAKRGFTDKEMALCLHVTERTFNNWKKRYHRFFQSLKANKDNADASVERSLYERACGYSHPDVHISNYQGKITVTPIIKHYPPDPTSMIFWLKNRRPDRWRDKQEVDVNQKTTLELSEEDRCIAKTFAKSFAQSETQKVTE